MAMQTQSATDYESALQPLAPRRLAVLLQELRTALVMIYGSRLREVILFGSYARGEAAADSDVDIAFVLDDFDRPWPEIRRTSRVVASLSLAYEVTVALLPMRAKDFAAGATGVARVIQKQPEWEGDMKRALTASVWREGEWFVAQCLEVDVASQGESEEAALRNLREALELHFEPPVATIVQDWPPVSSNRSEHFRRPVHRKVVRLEGSSSQLASS